MQEGQQTKPTKKPRFDSPEQEAFLNLWRTYDRLRMLEDDLFAGYDLTAQQYNVLRLLCAAFPNAIPTLTLGSKLISRAPDITRMLDKLISRGLAARDRSEEDRRMVFVRATNAGVELVESLASEVRECHNRQLGHLDANELRQMTELLLKARLPHEPEGSDWR